MKSSIAETTVHRQVGEATHRSAFPFATSSPDVGVTELAGPAPARQVLAGQLPSGRLDELGVVGQIAAE
jgi:hypothetical protein